MEVAAGFNLPERGSLILEEFRAAVAIEAEIEIEIEIAPTILFGGCARLYTLCRPGGLFYPFRHYTDASSVVSAGQVKYRHFGNVEQPWNGFPALLPDFSDRRWILPFLHSGQVLPTATTGCFDTLVVWRVTWALAGLPRASCRASRHPWP